MKFCPKDFVVPGTERKDQLEMFLRKDTDTFSAMLVGELIDFMNEIEKESYTPYYLINKAGNVCVYSRSGDDFYYRGYIDTSISKWVPYNQPQELSCSIDALDGIMYGDNLKSILHKWKDSRVMRRYRLFPNTEGNLAVSTHIVEGPQGPCGYYIGYIDFGRSKYIQFSKEFPGAEENTFLRDPLEVLSGDGHEINGPNGEVQTKEW